MSEKNPIFWEDAQQAIDRISGTYVTYDSMPAYVDNINGGRDGGTLSADLLFRHSGERKTVPLSDPGFRRFRLLPMTGWVNNVKWKKALLVERRPVRRTRHGYTNDSIQVGDITRGFYEVQWRNYNYDIVTRDAGYAEAHQGVFPPLEAVLSLLREGDTIAVSPLFAVHRDDLGLRWLYRLGNRVGLFPDATTLLLMKAHAYLREEIINHPPIAVTNLREF
ncbi:hypothetical protein KGP36_03085 [Patescibacteria group bacterium]|nr:hypothetical protein [Patescibacteria group bacterium]